MSGKGIATTAGVYLALAPLTWHRAGGFHFDRDLMTRIVLRVAVQLSRQLCCRSAGLVHGRQFEFTNRHDCAFALAIFGHRKNMQRLIAGTENRICAKKNSMEAAK